MKKIFKSIFFSMLLGAIIFSGISCTHNITTEIDEYNQTEITKKEEILPPINLYIGRRNGGGGAAPSNSGGFYNGN